MSARGGIVITGTEVLTGRVRDRNGPWLSERLRELGVDPAHLTVCGDRPRDMEAQLRFQTEQGVALILTSGGLGPTADDLTLEVVARFTGRELRLDEALEGRIGNIVEPLMKRWPHVDPEAVRAANRKQALVPEGATVIEPAGTAPGMVLPGRDGGEPTIVVLPGPPRELHSMWEVAKATAAFGAAIAGAAPVRQRTLRLFGIPESEIAVTLRAARARIAGFEELEITTCLRRGEVEVVVRHEDAAGPAFEELSAFLTERHAATLFSGDGSTVDEQVASLLAGRAVATAESCTGGLLAARLTAPPGASAYVAGGAVTYADEAKVDLLGVPRELIERHGAVSPEVAETMAAGALARFSADVAVAITGIAGPGGGTAEKPVGTVCWCAREAGGATLPQAMRMPGDRDEIRDRSTTVAMHLLRRLLRGEGPPP
ncbi:MAG: competence/damage-inducible protein A [Thermoleophilaceae bacterium]